MNTTRLLAPSDGVNYCCAMCGGQIGEVTEVCIKDRFDRVYCSGKCYGKDLEAGRKAITG